jgi:hypothetical protein
MVKEWEVRWEGELPAAPQDVWDAITQHADGYLRKVEYEPRVGGAERGLTAAFLGVRSADALYRVYGRDKWGWPVGIAHHRFAPGTDRAASQEASGDWLAGVFATERVA